MWVYEKRLQYPVNITQTNAKLAQVIISQFGGPDGELAASQRYLSQRYTMPDGMTKGLLNDIGTEELAHIEIVCAIIYQLTKNLSPKEKKRVELLHQLSKMLHLNVPLTSYVARHSWATTAKEEGVAIAMISEGLGHSSEKVTNVYLASFNNNAMSKANRKVISRIYPKKKKKR